MGLVPTGPEGDPRAHLDPKGTKCDPKRVTWDPKVPSVTKRLQMGPKEFGTRGQRFSMWEIGQWPLEAATKQKEGP